MVRPLTSLKALNSGTYPPGPDAIIGLAKPRIGNIYLE
jgi:hypothetical protein